MSTKIHVALSPGKLNGAVLSQGQRVDMKVFKKLWEVGHWDGVEHVIADKGYDYYELRNTSRQAFKTVAIPPQANAICPGRSG